MFDAQPSAVGAVPLGPDNQQMIIPGEIPGAAPAAPSLGWRPGEPPLELRKDTSSFGSERDGSSLESCYAILASPQPFVLD